MTKFPTSENFAEFEFSEVGVKLPKAEKHVISKCWGSMEETLATRKVEKKCGGSPIMSRVSGAGNGSIKLTGHWPYDVYCAIFAMEHEDLVPGVMSYGRDSLHPELSFTFNTENEDGVKKFKAYPRAKVTNDLTRKIERGSEEVAEVEVEIDLFPDEFGRCMYEAIEDNLEDASLAEKWMEDFEPSLVIVQK